MTDPARATPVLPPALARLMARRPPERAGVERCELCSESIAPDHGHVVDVQARSLLCSCRACYLLFTVKGAAQGRYVSVPDRYRTLDEFSLDPGLWDQLDIPVGVASIFRNSALGRVVALYPGPAGATESLLPLEAWPALVAANPALADVQDDVEAVLLRKTSGGFECHIAPIEVPYELVARLRRTWRGFGGGDEAWREVDEVFARVRARGAEAGR